MHTLLPVPTADAPLAGESGISGPRERIETVHDREDIAVELLVSAAMHAALDQVLFGGPVVMGSRRERK